MSDQRKTAGDRTPDDVEVSDLYRELAKESTPTHLDDAVLTMALAGKARKASRYATFSRWMRPATVVATIGLSLAVVMEYSRTPTMDPVQTPAAESLKEEFAPKAADVIESAEARARLSDGMDSVDAEPDRSARAEVNRSDDSFNDVTLEESEKKRVDAFVSSAPGASNRAMRRQAPEPALESATVQQDQQADESAVVYESAISAYASSQAGDGENQACDEEQRATATTWRVCIDELLEAGADIEAAEESAAFRKAYPDK